MNVEHDVDAETLFVKLDRSKIFSHGRPAIGDLLLRLHIYRCTADVDSCKAFYEELTRVEGVFLEWRDIVIAKKSLSQIFVQANTFLKDGEVYLKEYEPTAEGIIRSWAERWV